MEKKKPFGARLEAFFAGKGFYIVLFLCVAVIGVSAWSMLSGSGKTTESTGDVSLAVANMEEEEAAAVAKTDTVTVTEPPAATPTPTEAPPAAAPMEEDPVPAAAEVQDYYIWPVGGTVENGYSMAALTYDRTMQDWRTHDGLDIAADIGTQVRAAANGKVAKVYDDDRYGTTVVITHQNGLESTYSNLAVTPTVNIGDQVGVGQVIGAVGSTALCEVGEVSHLHFAMSLNGESVDPTDYMP